MFVGLAGHRAGWPWAEYMLDRASIVARAGSYQCVEKLQPEKTNCAACSRWGKKEKKKHIFSLFSHSGGTRKILAVFLKQSV